MLPLTTLLPALCRDLELSAEAPRPEAVSAPSRRRADCARYSASLVRDAEPRVASASLLARFFSRASAAR